MSRIGISAPSTTGVLLATLLLAGCSNGSAQHTATAASSTESTSSKRATSSTPTSHAAHELVLTATGDSPVKTLTYALDGRAITAVNLHLPWHVSLPVPADGTKHTYSVTVKSDGSVQLEATVDGSLLESSSGSGGATTDLNGWLQAAG